MKLNILETHDRLEHFVEDQSINIFQGADDCLKRNSLSLALQEKSPYIYLFAHPRTADDGVTKIMYWQPRLTKPEAQSNSYLFRAISKTDNIEICWLIPAKEMWGQYKKGNVTENEIVTWSINQYIHNKNKLQRPEEDDLPDHKIKSIYEQIRQDIKYERMMRNLYTTPSNEGVFLLS
jgi:hypothetical protein